MADLGEAYMLRKPGQQTEHLWVLVTRAHPDNGQAIVVNITTLRERSDTTTVLGVGDHPFIKCPKILFRVSARDALIVIDQSAGYDTRFWTQEIRSQSSDLMRFYQLAHGLRCLGFCQPVFAAPVEFLLRRTLTGRVHPTGKYSVAANAIGRVGIGDILGEGR